MKSYTKSILACILAAVLTFSPFVPVQKAHADDYNWGAFDVRLTTDAVVEAGAEAAFSVAILNNTDTELSPELYVWYYQEKGNSETYPGVPFGTLSGDGLSVNDSGNYTITLDTYEEAYLDLAGTIPDTWNDQSQIIIVASAAEAGCMGQGVYEVPEILDFEHITEGETYFFDYSQVPPVINVSFVPSENADYSFNMSLPEGDYDVNYELHCGKDSSGSSRNSVYNRDYDQSTGITSESFNCFTEPMLAGGECRIKLTSYANVAADGTGWFRIQKSSYRTLQPMYLNTPVDLQRNWLGEFTAPETGAYQIAVDSREGSSSYYNWGWVKALYGMNYDSSFVMFRPEEQLTTDPFYLEAGQPALIDVYFNGSDAVLSGTITIIPYEEPPVDRHCGDNAEWELIETESGSGKYVLKITGTGDTYDYMSDYSDFDPPWYAQRTSIVEVDVAEGITSIGSRLFSDCSNLEDVSLPSTLKKLGYNAFNCCGELEEIKIPEGLTEFGNAVFNDCSALRTANIPEGITTLPLALFRSCYSLTDITIPHGVTTIGDRVFENCRSLTEITIPLSVTTIGRYVFNGCYDLTIYYPETEAYWDANINNGNGTSISKSKIVFKPDHVHDYDARGYCSCGEFIFTDVDKGIKYVSWAYENDIVKGTGDNSFSPDDGCTRAQFIMMLWKMHGSPTVTGVENPFSDVSGSKTIKAIKWALNAGAIKSGPTFDPNGNISRVQIVMILWKLKGSPVVSGDNPFTDVSGKKTIQAVLWAYNNSITKGTSSTTFSPDTNCTRVQLVTFLYKYALLK